MIELEPLYQGASSDRQRAADAIGDAARTSGLFYIANHGIHASLIERAYERASEFFELPIEQKLEVNIAKAEHHSGYVPVSERGLYLDEQGERHYEAFDTSL